MIVVTAGSNYLDIDSYACCVAYSELLNLLGMPAIAASSAPLNESITQSLRSLGVPFSPDYLPGDDDRFVLVDISEPSKFDRMVDEDKVVEVYDHHPGFERYWQDKIGPDSLIEPVGAAATLIYEQWDAAGWASEMSVASAELLAAAILDNTLNFGASITTERDREAYAFLSEHASLDEEWVAGYFSECQDAILADLSDALRKDTKFISFAGFDDELCVGQIVVWDAASLIKDRQAEIASVLGAMDERWIANVVSIAAGKSYFIAQDTAVKTWAENLLDIRFDGTVATADRLWLRKEIMKADIVRSAE